MTPPNAAHPAAEFLKQPLALLLELATLLGVEAEEDAYARERRGA